MPGWTEDVQKAQKLTDLPANARAYIDRIEELLETPVCAISVGERRDQTILID